MLYSVHSSPKNSGTHITPKKIEDAKMLEKHSEMKNRKKKAKIQKDKQGKRLTVFCSLRLLHVL